ncbi:ATP-grasp domain-containing protein [Coprobacillus sp. AM17-34]|nr:ATP-grasp domain-containing protein [Coprobacillus sp. AM17-34]
MKKILLLGGSAQQVIAIETAKRLGYYTILCDFLDDNPGQYAADKFYLESTTDKEKILEIAEKEKIDGILAYASDPAAPTAAYVAEKLGLPGNPYDSVEILCNKDRFRKFLAENDFCTPQAKGYSNVDDAINDLKNNMFKYPIIIKPVDSSGSKGATVLNSIDDISNALCFAFSFSKTNRIIIEEYIEKKHKYLVGGDIFVVDGKIELFGLLNCHRDNKANPLVPVGKSYPLLLEKQDIEAIKKELQRLITGLHIKFGSVNVELVIDKNDNIWFIDIGPRAGGNMIPDLLSEIYKIDLVEKAVLASMGETVVIKLSNNHNFYSTYNLHSINNGLYKKIDFSKNISQYIIKKSLYKKAGDKVEYFDNASKALGIVFMKFDNMEQMLHMMDHSDEWCKVLLEN